MDDWIPTDRFPPPPHGWTCFHCGETFRVVALAAAHFGIAANSEPACVTKLQRGESWAAARVREVEQERDELYTRLAAARLGLNREREDETVDRLRAGRGLSSREAVANT